MSLFSLFVLCFAVTAMKEATKDLLEHEVNSRRNLRGVPSAHDIATGIQDISLIAGLAFSIDAPVEDVNLRGLASSVVEPAVATSQLFPLLNLSAVEGAAPVEDAASLESRRNLRRLKFPTRLELEEEIIETGI